MFRAHLFSRASITAPEELHEDPEIMKFKEEVVLMYNDLVTFEFVKDSVFEVSIFPQIKESCLKRDKEYHEDLVEGEKIKALFNDFEDLKKFLWENKVYSIIDYERDTFHVLTTEDIWGNYQMQDKKTEL